MGTRGDKRRSDEDNDLGLADIVHNAGVIYSLPIHTNTSGFYLQNYHNTVSVMYVGPVRLMKGSVASMSRKKRNARKPAFF